MTFLKDMNISTQIENPASAKLRNYTFHLLKTPKLTTLKSRYRICVHLFFKYLKINEHVYI